MDDRIRQFRYLAVLATVATYFLIFVGGLVRVSGAGLGCPDWPKCFGRWIPPTHVSQLPPEMDPALFNFTLAWIEYINRLIGVLVGLVIVIAAVYALIHLRKYPRLLIPTILAALLTAFQGWQGSQVVSSHLSPALVSVHMATAFLIVSLLAYASVRTYLPEIDPPGKTTTPIRLTGWTGLFWIIVIIQVILGTFLRATVEYTAGRLPLLTPGEWLHRTGLIAYIHSFIGILIGIAWMALFVRLRPFLASLSYIKQIIPAIFGLVIIQILFGLLLFALGNPPLIQLLHLWTAALLAGLILVLHVILKHYDRIVYAG